MSITRINSLGITDGTIVNGDINASAAIASTKLTGVNDAKAWVNFNGTGTVAIRGSFNVSSITDNGTGDYTVNLTTALTDANYSWGGSTAEYYLRENVSTARTSSILRIQNFYQTTLGGGITSIDSAFVSVSFFR